MELKPGEYVDGSGLLCRVVSLNEYAVQDGPGYQVTIVPTNPGFSLALAALQALWEEEQWVVIGNLWRIRKDGAAIQYRPTTLDPWAHYPDQDTAVALAYRAGLERGKG